MAVKKGSSKTKAKSTAKKPVSKKATSKKITAARSTTPKKASVVKGAIKKTTSKKTASRKTAVKKAPVKKAQVKKSTTKKSSAKKTAARKAPVRKSRVTTTTSKSGINRVRKTKIIENRFSKTEIVSELATNTQMTRKQVNAVLDELALLIERHVKKRSVGEFVLAGLIKIHTVKRPAKKSYTGINPFTGQETVFKARPASVAVKVHALKGLVDMAQ